MGTTSDRWSGGAAHEAYIGRWSLLVTREFLAWLEVPSGRGGWTSVA